MIKTRFPISLRPIEMTRSASKITAQKNGPIVDRPVDAFGSVGLQANVRKMLKYRMIPVSGRPVALVDCAVGAGDVIELGKKTGLKK